MFNRLLRSLASRSRRVKRCLMDTKSHRLSEDLMKCKDENAALWVKIDKLRDRTVDPREIATLEHNSRESMNKFFDVIEDADPYVHFGDAVREIIQNEGIDLDGKSVIDYGVGPGIALKQVLLESTPKCVVACDFSESALQKVPEHVPEALLRCHDIYDQPDDRYDFLLCTEVLEHLEYPFRALVNLTEAMNSGASLLLTVPDGRIDYSLYHINFWSPESWSLFLQGVIDSLDSESLSLKVGTFGLDGGTHRNNFAVITKA